MGARVTGVTSTRNLELVRALGADRVIDYTREDFTRGAERYDLIVDNVGNHALSACRGALAPGGRYVIVGGPSGRWLDPIPRLVAAKALSPFVREELRFFMAQLDPGDLETLRDLVAAGKVKPVVDRRYPLAQVAEAMAYLETGRARGKVVVTFE
jgi:NADPH:quinone reductase-like Zn-dependent oxidoreductase